MLGGEYMATTIQNQASIRYQSEGTAQDATSNVVTTEVIDQYTLSATKIALKPTFRSGENMTYVTRIENVGNGPITNIEIRDDLGQGQLSYLLGTIRLYLDGVEMDPVITATDDALSITYNGTLNPGQHLNLVYMTRVLPNIGEAITTITNTQTITGRGGSTEGPIVSVTPQPNATITRGNYAEVQVLKEASAPSIVSGQPLTYTFTLTNTGNTNASDVVLQDTLPQGFTVTQVQSTTGQVTTTYDASQYTIDENNTITLPNQTGTAIIVPPMSQSGPGMTVITITGNVQTI